MSTITETTAYIVHNNDTIWGYGPTAAAAWQDFLRTMDKANVCVVVTTPDDADAGDWTAETDYTIRPASLALVALVETTGGNVRWDIVDGVAVTRDEAEAA
jgi:hypothetical protein